MDSSAGAGHFFFHSPLTINRYIYTSHQVYTALESDVSRPSAHTAASHLSLQPNHVFPTFPSRRLLLTPPIRARKTLVFVSPHTGEAAAEFVGALSRNDPGPVRARVLRRVLRGSRNRYRTPFAGVRQVCGQHPSKVGLRQRVRRAQGGDHGSVSWPNFLSPRSRRGLQ